MVNSLKNLINMLSGSLLAMLLTGLISNVQAEQVLATSGPNRTPIVELYTSEGCSSCPAADQWIAKLGDAIGDEIQAVPLAFHVDYWNRLGWPDPFSDSRFTERQRQLAFNNKQRSIYTPEFLVSGRESRGTTAVVKEIRRANSELAKVMISFGVIKGIDNNVTAEMLVDSSLDGAELYLAVFENNIVRQIKGGENKGRTLHHDFVVRHWDRAATLGQGEYKGLHNIEIGEDWNMAELGLAAVVIDPSTGDTLQALSADIAPVFNSGS